MSGHTPGPWTFDGKYVYANEIPLVRLHPGAPDSEANARLMSKSPELLDACRDSLIEFEASHEVMLLNPINRGMKPAAIIGVLRNLIAKIEGRL